ncbi:MAG TPA: metal-dependent transcriptional regulator [Acidobacteriota bacterium]|nr:metal-dependent transcriptional regulator [Acidobacteriota bacterium]
MTNLKIMTSTVEDYLKALLRIEENGKPVTTSDIARTLAVADSTVTDMFRKLDKAGLLKHRPYYGATLTPKGRKAALKILRRHRLVELFLHDILGYGWEQVHEEAEELEHVVSDRFIERVDMLLNHPVKDPHGEPIPDAEGRQVEEEGIVLTEAAKGDYRIVRISNGRSGLFDYLEGEGLRPGQRVAVLDRAPFGGPLVLRPGGGKRRVYLGLEAAGSIYVRPLSQEA